MSRTSPSFTDRRTQAGLQDNSIFRALVDSARDYAIFVLDPQGIISTWNIGAQRIKRYKAEEIIGRHFSVFYPQEDIRNGKPQHELVVASQTGRFEDEGWRLRKDGSRFWANVIITALRNPEGELIGFGKITRDLTDRRAAEQRYRLLIEGVTDYAIYSLDPTGHITSWNTGAQRIKGYTAEEIVGKHFSLFYTKEDAQAGLPERVLKIAETQGHFEAEGWRVRKDGTPFWSSVVVTPLHDEEGKLSGFSKITRDVTDRKRLMDELQRHADELELQVVERERINAELEAFSYSVSHDLRAPLRAIEGFANALLEDYGERFDDTAKGYLDQIMTAATRMNRLVQDLLNYGRLNRMDVEQHPVQLRPLLDRIIKEVTDDPRVVTFKGDLAQPVCAHEATLLQVLSNLVSNALKFHKPGVEPRVTITGSPGEPPDSVRVSVTDNGIGIAPHHIEKIFKVFERLHGIEEYPGTGIGLAIVKRGVERMGGRFGVESRPGHGSTFWFELPKPTAAGKGVA